MVQRPDGKWECQDCGYVYDPAIGDPKDGVPPGVPFDELDEDWVCPDCFAFQERFEKAA